MKKKIKRKVLRGRKLAELFAKVNLPKVEAKAWRSDLRTARKRLKPPKNKWR